MELSAALRKLAISESTFHRRLRRAGIGEGDRIQDGRVTPTACRILGLVTEPHSPAVNPLPTPDFREWAAVTASDPSEPPDAPQTHGPDCSSPREAELTTIVEAQRREIARLTEYIEGCDALLGEMVRTLAAQEDRIRILEARHLTRAGMLSGLARIFARDSRSRFADTLSGGSPCVTR